MGIYSERKWSINKAAYRNGPSSLPYKVKDGNSLLTNRSWSFFLYSSNSRNLGVAQPRSRGSLLLVVSQERRTLVKLEVAYVRLPLTRVEQQRGPAVFIQSKFSAYSEFEFQYKKSHKNFKLNFSFSVGSYLPIKDQAPVVQTLDSAIHRIKISRGRDSAWWGCSSSRLGV